MTLAGDDHGNRQSLVICGLLYAELCIHFASQRDCDEFLEANDIRVEPLSRAAHFHAGSCLEKLAKAGGRKSRILLDLLIVSHAELQADRLLSRDRGFSRDLFPSLTLIDPSRD